MRIFGHIDVTAYVIVGKRHVEGRCDGYLSRGVAVDIGTSVGHSETPADVTAIVLDKGHLVKYLCIVLYCIVHLVDEWLLKVGIEFARLQLHEFLAVILCHLVVLGKGAGGLLVAVHILVSDCQVGVAVHVKIFIGTLHSAVFRHAVAGTEECDAGNKTDGEITVHALYSSSVHITPFHIGLDIHQLLENTAIDNVLVGAGLVNLLTPFGGHVVVRYVTEEIAHKVVAVSLQTSGLALDLLHLVGIADAAGIDAGTYLIGTFDGLEVVVPYFLHITPSHIARALERPYGLTVVGGDSLLDTHRLHIGVLHPHTAHT